MAQSAPRNPPLAGRPPFATDDEDEIYSTPQPQRRIRQKPAPDPNSRSSAYNMYDQYIDDSKRQSGAGALGMGFMNGDMDSDDDDDDDEPDHKHNNKHSALAAATHPQAQSAIPLASPRPGYAAPIAALNLSRPSPAATPEVRQQPPEMQMPQAPRQPQMRQGAPQMSQPQMSQIPQGLRPGPGALAGSPREPPPPHGLPSPRAPPSRLYASSLAPSTVPSAPHPLEEPMTPITPAFLRPSKSPDNVQFVMKPIIRSGSEDHLLPRRGDKGDDFWRRFSMVAKEGTNGGRESSWLVKTQSGTTSLSRWVWITGVFLVICIAGGIVAGWYFTHNDPSNQAPEVFGGSANEGISSSATSSSSVPGPPVSSSPHVSPTNTVARRAGYPEPAPTSIPFQILHLPKAQSGLGSPGGAHVGPSKRHSRHANRTQH